MYVEESRCFLFFNTGIIKTKLNNAPVFHYFNQEKINKITQLHKYDNSNYS